MKRLFPLILLLVLSLQSEWNPIRGASKKKNDFKEIWDMFEGKNLKLVLQGHMHLYEEIKVLNVQFITAGAVSASWWSGPYHGTQEGYLLVDINGDNFNWKYIDYGWNAK